MPKKKIDWIRVNKIIISIEMMLFFIVGLVVSSLYFAWDYSGFIRDNTNTAHFWIGFGILTAIIVCSGGILASFLIALTHASELNEVREKNNKNKK